MSSSPIRLDGSEGGGHVLRSALALSLVTTTPFVVERIGGPGRRGLDARMLANVRAAQLIGAAEVEGAVLGSERLSFSPRPVRAGDYLLDLGASGAVPDAVQIMTPALSLAGTSVVKLRGGTHLADGSVVPYLTMIWLPLMREIGFDLDLELHAAGFEPEGGGEVSLCVRRAHFGRSLDRRSRGTLCEVRVLSTISNVGFEIATCQSERAIQRLKESGILAEAENIPVPAPRSRGSMCLVIASFERGCAGFASVGASADDPRRVGERAADACVDFIRSRGAFDSSLAAQVVIPMAVAAVSAAQKHPVFRLTAPRLTDALLVEASVVGRFLDVEVALLAGHDAADQAEVRVAHVRESLIEALKPRVPVHDA